MYDTRKEKEKKLEMEREKKKFEEYLTVQTRTDDPNKLNFEKLFQGNLPPEAKELEDFINKFKDKDTSKDKDI